MPFRLLCHLRSSSLRLVVSDCRAPSTSRNRSRSSLLRRAWKCGKSAITKPPLKAACNSVKNLYTSPGMRLRSPAESDHYGRERGRAGLIETMTQGSGRSIVIPSDFPVRPYRTAPARGAPFPPPGREPHVHTSRDRVLNRRRENRRGDSPRIHERDRPLERRVLEYSKPAEPADVCTRMDFSLFVRLRGRISREDIIGRSNRGGAVEGRWRNPPSRRGTEGGFLSRAAHRDFDSPVARFRDAIALPSLSASRRRSSTEFLFRPTCDVINHSRREITITCRGNK